MKKYIYLIGLLFIFTFQIFGTNYYVKPSSDGGSDANDGLSWVTAKATIQGAINASGLYDYIFVKYGTYDITSEITFPSSNGGRRLTSDDGTHTDWSSAIPDSSQCILQGDGTCRIFFASSAIGPLSRIRGFKVTGGNATASPQRQGYGGGMCFIDAMFTIERCWITGNTGSTSGSGYGGGIAFEQSSGGVSPTLQYCRIEGNIGTTSASNIGHGGAVYFGYGHNNATFKNNFVKQNIGSQNYTGYGGGLFTYSPITITNNVFTLNKASETTTTSHACRGGAIMNWATNSSIVNNTFYSNASSNKQETASGNGIYNFWSTGVSIINNVFHSSGFNGDGRAVYSDSEITISYNLIYNYVDSKKYNDLVTSTNEINLDPRFKDRVNDDYSLLFGASPCVNAGDPTYSVPEGGEPSIDIGAFEYIKTTAGWDACGTTMDNPGGTGISYCAETNYAEISSIQQNLNDPTNLPDGCRHIGKYWTIGTITEDKLKIRLYYRQEACALFTGSPTIYHYTSGEWQSLPTSGEIIVGTSRYVETLNYYSSFSDVTVGDSEAPLPVELAYFIAELTDENVQLNWETATEVNNYGFEVQRQYQVSSIEYQDSSNWEKIGFVEGHGTANSPKFYSFIDENLPDASEVSYRLKQIDLDGTFSYSKVIVVDISTITSVEEIIPVEYSLSQNYPNPFNPSTTIKFGLPETGFVDMRVYNILGEEIAHLINKEMNAGYQTVNFGSNNIPSGIYIYTINVESKFGSVKKMLLIK